MEVVMLTQSINSLFSSLGCPVGDDYFVGDDCQATLEEILTRLYKEDKYVRGFRRVIANSQVLKKDLLPLFYKVKDDHKVLDLIIEILENLMIPVECLFPIDILIKEDAGRSTIFQLNWLLTSCKEAFLNPCATKAVLDYIKIIIKKDQHLTTEGCRSVDLCLRLMRNLLHIPEVRGGAPGGGASHQNQIIWSLFTQHVDKVLIHLMTCSSRALWSITIVQLISLLYKDQQSNTIHKLLNNWCNSALSESSEDDESNTSLQDQRSNDCSSSMSTSETTSDSSDSDHKKRRIKSEAEVKHQCHPPPPVQTRMTEMLPNGSGRKAQVAMRNKHGNYKNVHPTKHRQQEHTHVQEIHANGKQGTRAWGSESGLGTSICSSQSAMCCLKMEFGSAEISECDNTQNQETISTSSNEDKELIRFGNKKKPVHQKPPNMVQKSRYSNGKIPLSNQARKDLLREKLKKRSRTTTMSIKTFLNHTPSEEDISQLLKEFTVDFLLKGYGYLTTELKVVVLTNQDINMDTSHFTWLIMFFLRFASQLELDLEIISPVLSYDIISYLTYEGVNLCEELEVAKLQVGENLSRTLCKMYLVVASLKEIIFTIESYKKFSHLSQNDHKYLRTLQEKICCGNDLKHLFVLLLRHFDPLVQSHQFLQEVVVANHSLLVLVENCRLSSKKAMAEHIRQFATEDVMKQYGVLLACFKDNDEAVNNCIFTMMHHVAGDLDKVSILFQPSILRSFALILESGFPIRDDWSDLVEYVLQQCLKAEQQTKTAPTKSVTVDECMNPSDITLRVTVPEQVEQPGAESVVADWGQDDLDSLCWFFPQSIEMADPIGHISQLFIENWGRSKTRIEIVHNLFKQGLIADEDYKSLLEKELPMGEHVTSQQRSVEMDILEGIQVIIDYLHAENCDFFVKWLQNCLLEACYARLVLDSHQQSQYELVEPVAYFYTMLKQPVPLVTWTQELWKVMQLEPSIWLLSALNFHLPTRAGQAKIFARIPSEWTADHLYVAALILGPVDSNNIKFDPSTLQVIQHPCQAPSNIHTPNIKGGSSIFGYFVGSSSTADWLQKVGQLKSFPKTQPLEDKHERMSIISGDERDWDLTSLCVSDVGRHDDAAHAPFADMSEL